MFCNDVRPKRRCCFAWICLHSLRLGKDWEKLLYYIAKTVWSSTDTYIDKFCFKRIPTNPPQTSFLQILISFWKHFLLFRVYFQVSQTNPPANFLSKFAYADSLFCHLRGDQLLKYRCASLNHRKKKKAEPCRLIPRKLTANLQSFKLQNLLPLRLIMMFIRYLKMITEKATSKQTFAVDSSVVFA